jgi:hypothetical protein
MMMGPTQSRIAVTLLVVLGFASNANATWSILITDVRTREVALGIATCVNGIDLLSVAGVVVVDRGAGAAQSFVDVEGTRRATIFNGLLNGTSPADILTNLEAFAGHQTRQYGIADTIGGTLTFTGSSAFAFAGGVTGSSGFRRYAVQGNILTGDPVIAAAEQAILTSTADVPATLMAAMEAARAKGGDGRCSCPGPDPTACGSPPASFTNSAINGGVLVSRRGDGDDSLCDAASGCVGGDYFMKLDVAGQTFPNTDPVLQLQTLFNAFRTAHQGRPDAIRSQMGFAAASGGVTTATVFLRDWQDQTVTAPITSVTVAHAAESDGLSTIGPVVPLGGGLFSVTLTGSTATGVDRFVVTADDGIRPVILMPDPALQHVAIDVKPGSAQNTINLKSAGIIPVAILSSATFDAAAVNPPSLSLAGGSVRVAGKSGKALCHVEDVNADGRSDLVCQFENDLEAVPGDTVAVLVGVTVDGTPFRGQDSIRIVPD